MRRIARTVRQAALGLCLATTPVAADTFPCTESGLDDAIAMGGGPHQMRCGWIQVSGTKSISGSLILEAEHPGGRIAISGGPSASFRLFHVLPGGSLELRRAELSLGNAAGAGGNLLNEGSLTLRESEVLYGNAGAGGGGIASSGTLLLDRVSIGFNTAVGEGGGLLTMPGASTTILASAITGNDAIQDGSGAADGGGLHLDGTSILENVTVSGNSAERDGGGILLAGGSASLHHVTLADNTAVGAGSAIAGPGSASATASVLVGACSLPVASGGGNLGSPDASCVAPAPGDQSAVSPAALRLDPLAWYGGPTLSHRLGSASAAIDFVTGALCPAGGADQRGAPRPDALGNSACDAGAVESTHLAIRSVERIAATGDPDPRGASSLGVIESASLAQGHVAFVAVDSTGERSLYLRRGDTGALSHVAGASTPVPGGTGTFDFDDIPPPSNEPSPVPLLAASEDAFAFFFPSRRAPGPGPVHTRPYLPDRGFYRFDSDGALTRCAGVGDPVDGGPESLELRYELGVPFDTEPGGLLFTDPVVGSPGSGIYRCTGGAVSELLPATETLPNGDTLRHVVRDVFALAESLLWGGFRSVRPAAGGAFAPLDDGLFELDVPGGPSAPPIKSPFASGVASDARRSNGVTHVAEPFDVISVGGVQAVRYGQVAHDASGSFETAQRFHPGGGLPDRSTLVGGVVYAGGSIGNPSSFFFCNGAALVTNLGGVIEPVLQAGDVLDGKQVICTGIGRNAVEADRLAVVSELLDAGEVRWAVYLTTLPEPGATLGLGAGAGLLAALARRRRR